MKDRRVYLKNLPPTAEGKKDDLDYKKMLVLFFENSPVGGLTVGQIKDRLALIARLNAATEYVDLSHREHEGLVTLLQKEKWTVISSNLVAFIDDLRDAPVAGNSDPDVLEFREKTVASA